MNIHFETNNDTHSLPTHKLGNIV